MQIKDVLSILTSRHYLVTDEESTVKNNEYYNAYLLANYGIVVDKPNLLSGNLIDQISSIIHLNVPDSFYSNPQDLKYFTKDELLVEQIVSYFAYGSDLGRIELFKKDLPEYVVGDELKLRTFYIVNVQEASEILSDIKSLCTSHVFTTVYDVNKTIGGIGLSKISK
jgi:hypothetical protein